jgi:hypothetical protein
MSEMPPSMPEPAQRNGCLTAFMVVAGVVLLLPGLCALIFTVGSLSSPGGFDETFLSIVVVGLLAGAGGVAMIWWAVRSPRR